MNWISVKDRLPELRYGNRSDCVLICYENGSVSIGIYYADIDWADLTDDDMWRSVTHWMPLPKPPKGE